MLLDFLKKYKKRFNYTGTDIPPEAIADLIAVAESLGYAVVIAQTQTEQDGNVVRVSVTHIATGDSIVDNTCYGATDSATVIDSIRLHALVLWVDHSNRVDG